MTNDMRKYIDTVSAQAETYQWTLANTPLGSPAKLDSYPDGVDVMVALLAHVEGGGNDDQYLKQFVHLIEQGDIDGINKFILKSLI